MTHPLQGLVFDECRLLDEGRLDEWLALFAADATYWLPIHEHADPLKDSSIIYDDHTRLAMRVEQIMRQHRVAQTPRSETLHQIGNLEITDAGKDRATARYALTVTEVRHGDWRQTGLGDTRVLPGRCTLELRQDPEGWRIVHKRLVLLHRHHPITGLSYLL